MYILNGRTLGDLTGKFTCHTLRGSSVVDNFITCNSLSYLIFSINVYDISLFSDHCLISMKLKICFDNRTDESLCEANLKYTHLPDKFLWSDVTKVKYQETFNSIDVRNKLTAIDTQRGGLYGCPVYDSQHL